MKAGKIEALPLDMRYQAEVRCAVRTLRLVSKPSECEVRTAAVSYGLKFKQKLVISNSLPSKRLPKQSGLGQVCLDYQNIYGRAF